MRCDARVGRREGGGNGTRDIYSFIHSLSGINHQSNPNRWIVAARLGRMDRVTRASRGMRMTRDVRETDASSFRFADEGDVQLYARG